MNSPKDNGSRNIKIVLTTTKRRYSQHRKQFSPKQWLGHGENFRERRRH